MGRVGEGTVRNEEISFSASREIPTAKLLAKDPEDRYSGATELAEDLRRGRDGFSLLAAEAGEQSTVPVAGMTEELTGTAPTMVAPGQGVPQAGSTSARRRPSLPLVALLIGVALLGGLAWALLRGPSERDARDAGRDAGGAALVEVPDVVGLSRDEARKRLEGANLKLGSQDEASSDEAAEGLVIKQNPAAGTEAGRGSAVDVTVGTGPALGPARPSSPTASPSASPTASPSASPSVSPASAEGAREAAKEAQKAAEEAAKEREKAREEALKRAEERRKVREEAREERQKAREEARKEAKE